MDFLDINGIKLEVGDYVEYINYRAMSYLGEVPQYYIVYALKEKNDFPVRVVDPLTGVRNGLTCKVTRFVKKIHNHNLWVIAYS